MKVFLYYEDNENEGLHKTLKITLPKSWKTAPTCKLLTQFVESYNTSGLDNKLDEQAMHLSIIDADENLVDLASDAVTQDVIPDRANVFVRHGPATTLESLKADEDEQRKKELEFKENTVRCTHFGCKNRFPRGGPYPECVYHVSAPVFHETAKWWSCCPNKKAYDWNDFEAIQGCQTGVCTDVKEQGQKQFLGGMELRAQTDSEPLRSIDDFNKAQAAGGTNAAPVLERLQRVMEDLGIEKELYNQVVDGMKNELGPTVSTDAELLDAVAAQMGSKLKAAMKAIAVEQLRIK